jgi:hypothetical protein
MVQGATTPGYTKTAMASSYHRGSVMTKKRKSQRQSTRRRRLRRLQLKAEPLC